MEGMEPQRFILWAHSDRNGALPEHRGQRLQTKLKIYPLRFARVRAALRAAWERPLTPFVRTALIAER